MHKKKRDSTFDTDPLSAILSLTEHLDIEPKRNELCYCMSGKKYKKCCIDNEKISETSGIESKGFYLIPDTDSEVFQYDMNDEDYNIAADSYDVILMGGAKEDLDDIDILNTLLEKHPDHPVLNTAQALIHLTRGDKKAFTKVAKINLKKFPDNKINHLLLKYHKYESLAKEIISNFQGKVEKHWTEDLSLKETYDKEKVCLSEFLLTFSLQI